MRKRVKALTVAAAMVTTFAILPTFGAAAAEPLEDGSYDVTVGESVYTVEVVDGTPTVDHVVGVEFTFDFDDETERVLDEFDVAVGGTAYEVEVADDGTATVTEHEPAASEDEPAEESEDEGDEDDGQGEDTASERDEDADEASDDEGAEVESLEEADEAVEDDGEHGKLVSSVAECAPSGRTAREAGLPNHGFFVSAAARGESVEFEVDGEVLTVDLSTPEGAEELCTLTSDLVAADAEQTTEEAEAQHAEGEGRGNGKGRSGDAPGRSGDAPGHAKQGR